MPKRLSIQPQLTREELQRRYRTAQDPVARSHWQMVWLLAHGTPSEEVAAVTGYSLKWIRILVQRYNQQGPGGLGDRRRRNPGSMGLLSPDQRTALARALTQPPPDGGLWTGPKVAAWMAVTLRRPVYPQRGWEMLRRLGLTPQVPRPRHAKADPEAHTRR